ncbi:hypothetical protein GALMADRAFT_53578 [Galerina marginata CBS 339.88]|uniref:Protein kinase domain-containing protein n=1 Tax=Galerina marginata (strain CBS 339.88) TaxID=685588 RepID=A0A067TST0_GALM3|nr:hypothetical protein GALMADRAFT_53578 [Galerina marginata CBS 339.88]
MDICAKLVTTREGRKEAINLSLSKPAVIGRNPESCVRSPSGGVIISCQDLSRNGLRLNGQDIRKTAVILMDGDVITLPNSISFTCLHMWKESTEKLSLFEPTPPSHPVQKRIGKYIVTSQCLGTGSFATVHLALDPEKHRQVACKSIRTKRDHEVGQVMKEVRILMTLKHPNINEIYDTEDKKKFIHIFLQLCTGGDLFTYITHASGTGNRICEAEAKYIMYQLLQALKYLHDKLISHRGMWRLPENILLYCPGPYPRIVIADFGLARPNSYQETFNVCGTVSYLPPEGILALDNKHLGYIGMPSDCWSAGVVLYIMLSCVLVYRSACYSTSMVTCFLDLDPSVLFSGAHPFDNEPRSSSNRITRTQGSRKLEGPYVSESYTQADLKVKEKIIHGEVEYFQDPWLDLRDGPYLETKTVPRV